MVDRNLLAESPFPNTPSFSRAATATAYGGSYNDKYHRGQSPPAHRPLSPIEVRGGRSTLDQTSEPSYEESQPEVRYANSRNDLRSLTLADAMYPPSHPYAHPETRRSPERQVVERGPEVNVHELAKEVAALIHPQPIPAPPNTAFVQVPSTMVTQGRPVRQLPNPGSPPLGDNESVLPRYER